MYHEYSQDELRAYCRRSLDTLEIWARRLIHDRLTEVYGTNYWNAKNKKGEYIIKSSVRKHAMSLFKEQPDRFPSPIDTLFLDDIIYLLCKPEFYSMMFKDALDKAYPQGREEAHEFLKRLIPIRNPLSHANPISIRQVEQAICYSHDFIDSLKAYYKSRGEEQLFNAPKIVRVSDSLGNVFECNNETSSLGLSFIVPQKLNCGDAYSVQIDVDSSFRSDEYTILWKMNGHDTREFVDSSKFNVIFGVQDVAMQKYIWCRIIQKKSWHRYGSHDSKITLALTILPPIE